MWEQGRREQALKKSHLPLFGIGPVYAIVIVLVTVLAVVLKGSMPSVMPPRTVQMILKLIGFFLLVLAGCIWVLAAVVSKIDEHILKNELVTDGIYAWVRNPLYAAFLLGCTGILLIEGNLLLLPLRGTLQSLLPEGEPMHSLVSKAQR